MRHMAHGSATVSDARSRVSRDERLQAVCDHIGDRKLVWFGTRGEDAWALLAIPQFRDAYSISARLEAASLEATEALEDATLRRVDLDRYDLDGDPAPELRALQRRMLRSLRQPSVLVAYRPSMLASSVTFPNMGTTEYAGMFVERHAPFEHKPWLETGLRQAGLPVVPWDYVANEDHLRVLRALESGPLVLRASRTCGGVGLVLLEDGADIAIEWPRQRETFVSVAPYLAGSLPLNVGACAFPTGEVTLHPPSVQLIGVPSCTNRPFGYCGNDFAAAADLDPNLLDDLNDLVVATGRWLARAGYVGAFGVDALVHQGNVLLTEVNPRFQGSSAIGAELARRSGVPDLYLDHLAAFFGRPAGRSLTLREWASERHEIAQVVCHNRRPHAVQHVPMHVDSGATEIEVPQLLPVGDVVVEPGAAMFRVVMQGPVTEDGYALSAAAERQIGAHQVAFREWL